MFSNFELLQRSNRVVVLLLPVAGSPSFHVHNLCLYPLLGTRLFLSRIPFSDDGFGFGKCQKYTGTFLVIFAVRREKRE